MAAASNQDAPVYVLTLDAVRWGVGALKAQRIHPFFLAYLHLRKRAVELGTESEIAADWDELGEFLRVKGGPPGKPYYRPFWNGKSEDPGRYWLNPNLAGSYAPSSLRQVPYKVVDTDRSRFSLKPDHWNLARKHLLYDERVPALAFAIFFYRDFGLITPSGALPNLTGLVELLREDFRFRADDPQFEALFSATLPETDLVPQWFESFEADTVGVE